jgi:hypothetical protein
LINILKSEPIVLGEGIADAIWEIVTKATITLKTMTIGSGGGVKEWNEVDNALQPLSQD